MRGRYPPLCYPESRHAIGCLTKSAGPHYRPLPRDRSNRNRQNRRVWNREAEMELTLLNGILQFVNLSHFENNPNTIFLSDYHVHLWRVPTQLVIAAKCQSNSNVDKSASNDSKLNVTFHELASRNRLCRHHNNIRRLRRHGLDVFYRYL